MLISIDNLYGEIKGASQSELNILKSELQTYAPGYKYTRAYQLYIKSRRKYGWDGRVSVLDGARFSTGLLHTVVEAANVKGIPVSLIDDNRFIYTPTLSPSCVSLRPYQEEIVNKLIQNMYGNLWYPRGVIKLPTGSGKTEIAVALHSMFNLPSLFLVHRKVLLDQTVERFNKYGIKTGYIGDSKFKVDTTNITVSTIQSLYSRLKYKKDLSFLNDFYQVFFDECHLMAASLDKGNIFIKISNLLPNAFIRWGLTATPFMKDVYSNLLLEGATGRVAAEIPMSVLIDEEYLAEPTLFFQTVPFKGTPLSTWVEAYRDGIVNNKLRNDLIVQWSKKLSPPILIFVNHIDHGKILLEKMKGLKAEFIHGENSKEERDYAVAELKSGKIERLIVSNIFDEGVDIPVINGLILAGGGKSPIKLLQRLGRGMRTTNDKKKISIVDFKDEYSFMTNSHSTYRKSVWKNLGLKIIQVNESGS